MAAGPGIPLKQIIELVDACRGLDGYKQTEFAKIIKIVRRGMNVNIAQRPLFQVPEDGLYYLSANALVKTADVGAGNAAITLHWTELTSGASTSDGSIDLTNVGSAYSASVDRVWLLGGSFVTFSIITPNPYGAATYDYFSSVLYL